MDKLFGGLNRNDLLGFLMPGAILLLVTGILFPELVRCLIVHCRVIKFSATEFQILVLAAFLFLSYAIGYQLSALGYLLDGFFWPDGFPTHTIFLRNGKTTYLHASQKKEVLDAIQKRFDLDGHPLSDCFNSEFTGFPVQIRAHLMGVDRHQYAQDLMSNYYIFRSLTISNVILSVEILLALVKAIMEGMKNEALTLLVLGITLVILIYASWRITHATATSYARELYLQFLESCRSINPES